MKNISLCISFLILVYLTYGQSGKTYASKLDPGSEKQITSLLDSARNTIDADPQKAFEYVEKALELSIGSNYRRGEALCNIELGKINQILRQPDLALDFYHRSLKLSFLLNKDELNHLYYYMGAAYEQLKNYDQSLDYYTMYLQYIESTNNINELIKVKYDLARVHTSMNNYDQALNQYSAIQAIEEERNDARGNIIVSNKMGEINQSQGKPQAAIANYQKSVEIADQSQNKKAKSDALRRLGGAYKQNEQPKAELDTRLKSLEISKEEEELSEQAEDNLAIAEIYIAQEQPEKAIGYIQKSIVLSDEVGDIENKGKALKSLSTAYKERGDYENALLAYKDYTSTVDSVYKNREDELRKNLDMLAAVNRKLQRIDMLELDFEINQRNLELLEKEQIINNKELENQKRISYALIFVLLIISVAAIFVYRSALEKRRANQLLAIKSLRSQMNPHFIFNSLNSVNNYIAQSNERMANKYLSDFSQLMRSVLENSKHDFVPLSSEIDIIRLYLKLEHARFQDKFAYNFIIDENLDMNELEIPPMLIQPYIENAVWHGLRYKEEKGMLKVEIKKEDKSLLVLIEDNGIGRKKSQELKTKHQKTDASTGLKNTKQRLDIINQMYRTNYSVVVEDLFPEEQTGTRVKIGILVNKR